MPSANDFGNIRLLKKDYLRGLFSQNDNAAYGNSRHPIFPNGNNGDSPSRLVHNYEPREVLVSLSFLTSAHMIFQAPLIPPEFRGILYTLLKITFHGLQDDLSGMDSRSVTMFCLSQPRKERHPTTYFGGFRNQRIWGRADIVKTSGIGFSDHAVVVPDRVAPTHFSRFDGRFNYHALEQARTVTGASQPQRFV
ncbi:uncharacterized protein BT62DRAFT_1076375 [Guyanagaster necrorhizus]|uniref:Uncharacterized protein n=1 Tax=Guyanagaster necrorhizus TaxID=856835 RepID=A0A9P7VSV9_9AGAR|nr:uncharacterized protein BT62DRAFT_1076375 [Guyanagaster necrorhizus MCA 3950]KAG7445962.1 hypothetical protein BT62DRAFT_1076375 [Guyanagaster necrorhizus MCA 3950]